LEQRTVEELRELLAAVFKDMETYLDEATVEGKRTHFLRAGVGLPDPGKDWW
jgi:hypothetical protein